jgi:hypothetical protein
MRISHRVAKLERIEFQARPPRFVIQWGDDEVEQSVDQDAEVIVVQFVKSPHPG